MVIIEIYFNDLTEEKQEKILKTLDTTSEDENWDMDIFPIAFFETDRRTDTIPGQTMK